MTMRGLSAFPITPTDAAGRPLPADLRQLAGGYAAWVRGAPEPLHDVDFLVAEDDVPAVVDGRVVEADDDVASRWGPRIADFAETVAEALQG